MRAPMSTTTWLIWKHVGWLVFATKADWPFRTEQMGHIFIFILKFLPHIYRILMHFCPNWFEIRSVRKIFGKVWFSVSLKDTSRGFEAERITLEKSVFLWHPTYLTSKSPEENPRMGSHFSPRQHWLKEFGNRTTDDKPLHSILHVFVLRQHVYGT